MLKLSEIMNISQSRFKTEIENAVKGKSIDKTRVERRRNETYFTRLTKAILPGQGSSNRELSDPCYAICVACPEALFSKMYFLGWGESRKQSSPELSPPKLLEEYSKQFNDEVDLRLFFDLLSFINAETTTSKPYSLICHGLSPTSDTILLLADIGRNIRIASALGVSDIQVMLADVTWVKHNRSINQLMKKKDFMNSLRICLDKRKRLYKGMGFEYHVFGINDFADESCNISRSNLEKYTKDFRSLAETLWGKRSLLPHDAQTKKLIGTRFDGMRSAEKSLLSQDIATLVAYKKMATAIERELESQLAILRLISDLFSTFDEEIFLYYFAQFFSQGHFSNYIKIAPYSEIKFDKPFKTEKNHFHEITSPGSSGKDVDSCTGQGTEKSFEIYLPQYNLGGLQLLPYTSISGDVLRKSMDIDEFLNNTILLDDSYDDAVGKVIGIITETSTANRNRLVSDLLSFLHYLINLSSVKPQAGTLRDHLKNFDEYIAEQVFSQEDMPSSYPSVFAEWLKAIEAENPVSPFHIAIYFWEEPDWTTEKIKAVSYVIIELLKIVNSICD